MKSLPRGTIVAISLGLGLMAALLVYFYLSSQASEARTRMRVVTAREDIAPQTIITAGMLELRSFPRNELPPSALATPDLVVGKVANVAIQEGTPISVSSISPKNRLSHMIPPNMRAVTVAIDPIIGVAGFLKPGDHVDVVATFNSEGGTLTKTVLQDVQLLAAGSEVQDENPRGTDGSAQPSPNRDSSATLLVLPDEAEKLILAESKGKLRLALRRSDDPSITITKGITGRDVIGAVPPDNPLKQERYSSGYEPAAAPSPARNSSAPMYGGNEPASGSLPMKQPKYPIASSGQFMGSNSKDHAALAAGIKAMGASQAPAKQPKTRTILFVRGTQVNEEVVPE